jgi:hypothetical protein
MLVWSQAKSLGALARPCGRDRTNSGGKGWLSGRCNMSLFVRYGGPLRRIAQVRSDGAHTSPSPKSTASADVPAQPGAGGGRGAEAGDRRSEVRGQRSAFDVRRWTFDVRRSAFPGSGFRVQRLRTRTRSRSRSRCILYEYGYGYENQRLFRNEGRSFVGPDLGRAAERQSRRRASSRPTLARMFLECGGLTPLSPATQSHAPTSD